MNRLSIELTSEEHQKIAALQKLEIFLALRIKAAENGNVISSSAKEIFEETL